MAIQNRTNAQMNTVRTNRSNTYVYGSAAPKYGAQPIRRPEREQVRPTSNRTQTRQETQAVASPVNMPLFILSLVAFAAIAFMMIHYIRLNSDIKVLSTNIAKLEREVDTLRNANDEYYGRIMSNIDLDEVREIAIAELGMEYATADQIITYDSQIDDYVEQKIVIKD